MFHRVKLENQDEQNNQEEQEVAAVAVEETVEEQEVAQEKETDTQTTSVEEETVMDNKEQEKTERSYEIPAKTYQRSGQAASSVGGYPNSSYGASYKAAPVEEAEVEEPVAAPLADDGSDDRTLTIGRGITMSGEIEACDQLVVQGTVEASLKGARSLEISENGVFYGTVEIEEAVIAGRFEGEIAVNGRLVITETGVITGTVSYRELQVEAGAILDGRITPLRAQAAPQVTEPVANKSKGSAKTAAALAKAKEVKAQKNSQPSPANTDGGLFGEKAAVAE